MKRKTWFHLLYVQVLLGVLLGLLTGHFFPEAAISLKPLGDGFIKLVKMMLPMIVFCTVVGGIANLRESRGIAGALLKSLLLFYLLTLLALLIGWLTADFLQPGTGMHVAPEHLDASVIVQGVTPKIKQGLSQFVLGLIPQSYVSALTGGEVLPVLLISVLTGFALARTDVAAGTLLRLLESLTQIFFGMFNTIMRLAPIAAFSSIAFTISRYGLQSIGGFTYVILSFYLACLVFITLVLGVLSWLHGFSLWKLLRYVREELIVVLGTSSSEPALPCLQTKLEALGCKKAIVRVVLPLAYSFNLDGTAIYLTLATMFIAQACDIHIGTVQMISMIATMLLTSKGVAGVTGSGFIALVATLTVVPDIPLAGVALLTGIDRFMSEARALTSTISNVVVTILVALWENACDRDILAAQLQAGWSEQPE